MTIATKIEDLKPWMRGPFELIRHADGHLMANKDTDRRIALIGFDNAIEVSIDVFVRLHPRVRGGVEIPRAEVEAATRNYHTKIEFLDKHVQDRQIPLSIPVTEIVWYHQLRNELYHSGNGMVPEEHVIIGARSAALAVFHALFNVHITNLIADGGPAPKNQPQPALAQSQNPEMEFMRWFIELEQELRKFTPAEANRPMPLSQMWRALLKMRPELADADSRMGELVRIRNSIAHGHPPLAIKEGEMERLVQTILEILDRLHARPRN